MNAVECKDLECDYNSVNNYLKNLYIRCGTCTQDMDELVEAYMESQKELDTCTRRDWPIIKQSQMELCRKIVEIYIKKKAGG